MSDFKPFTANKRQVDGNHYVKHGNLQHWDIVVRYAIPYLPGNCTKYLFRWKDKNGIKDLEKALHYLEKMLEVYPSQQLENPVPDSLVGIWKDHFKWDNTTAEVIRSVLGKHARPDIMYGFAKHGICLLISAEAQRLKELRDMADVHLGAMKDQSETWSKPALNPLHYDSDGGPEPTAAQLHPG
jgi:hypothetical protein